MLQRLPAYALCFIIVSPILWITLGIRGVDTELWQHLWNYTIPPLLWHTFILLLGVIFVVCLLAIPLAWWCSVYDFYGRKLLEWLLIVPLAMPAYVLAFAHLGLFDLTGNLSLAWRSYFGSAPPWPSLRSAIGAILFLSLALYPYLFLLLKQAWSGYAHRALEQGAMLGHSRLQSLRRIVLPASWPYLLAGLSLIMMEVLADFGTVSILNYDTFTTAIHQSWYGFFSLSTAVQLAILLLLFVFLIYGMGHAARNKQRVLGQKSVQRGQLERKQAIIMWVYASIVLLLALFLPLTQLFLWAWNHRSSNLSSYFLGSLWAGSASAILITILAAYLAWLRHRMQYQPWWMNLASMGYAVPGNVLAVGLIVIAVWLPQYLRTTIFLLLWGYLTRFFAVGFANMNAGFHSIQQHHEQSAEQLGMRSWGIIRHLYWPLLRGSTGTALLLIFVDTLKEIPITLMTRPFGFDTLATRIFSLTSEGDWQYAAEPALWMIAISLIPTYWLARRQG